MHSSAKGGNSLINQVRMVSRWEKQVYANRPRGPHSFPCVPDGDLLGIYTDSIQQLARMEVFDGPIRGQPREGRKCL